MYYVVIVITLYCIKESSHFWIIMSDLDQNGIGWWQYGLNGCKGEATWSKYNPSKSIVSSYFCYIIIQSTGIYNNASYHGCCSYDCAITSLYECMYYKFKSLHYITILLHKAIVVSCFHLNENMQQVQELLYRL